MATKTLVRSGASLFSRLTSNPLLNTGTSSNHRVASVGLRITPQLFPSLSKPQTRTSLHFSQEDSESISKVSSLGFLYPTCLHSLRFFLPDGDSSDEPMLLFPKRTYQPSHIRRKRTNGFFCSRYLDLYDQQTFMHEQQSNQRWLKCYCSKNSKGSC